MEKGGLFPTVDAINSLLPQTQCERCGYPGCKPYAQAIAGGAAINKCPPGGAQTIKALAQLLATSELPLDPVHGSEGPRTIAVIREAECIGCTKCIQACPVDAIVGSAKLMHTVLEAECSGCDLCLDPCPVDCIDMLPVPAARPNTQDAWSDLRRRAVHYRARYESRQQRLARERAAATPGRGAQPLAAGAQAEIAAALARVKAKKALQQPGNATAAAPGQAGAPPQDQQQ